MGFGDKQKNYVVRDSIKEGDILTFVSKGEWKEIDFSKTRDGSNMKNTFQIKVRVNDGEPKDFNLNATSGNILAEAWGPEDEEPYWEGRKARVTFIKMLSFGETIEVLCLVPV